MPDYAGPLQRLALSRTLWLVVGWPILGFAWQAVVARGRIVRAHGTAATRRALASARNAGAGCALLSAVATFGHAVVLARSDAPALFEPVARGPNLGQLHAEIDLFFDPLSATFCALACLIALGVAVFLAARPAADAGWRAWAWLHFSLTGALVAFLADGFVGISVGWAMAGAAAAWLAGWDDLRGGIVSVMRSGLAIASLLVGSVLLFWGLGGTWDGDDYVPEPPPRFAAVRLGGWPVGGATAAERAGAAPSGVAELTFTSNPGALVFVDDTRTPSGQSPFVKLPVRSGAHTLRVHCGDGTNDDVLARVAFEDGEEIALAPVGPTLVFRAMADQLSLRDRSDDQTLRNSLQARSGPGGVAIVAGSIVALLLSAGFANGATHAVASASESGPTPRRRRGPPPELTALAKGATTAGLGPYLMSRFSFLFPMAPGTWIAVEAVGATILLMAGWRAPRWSGIERWRVFVGATPAALAYLALAAAGVTPAIWAFVLSGATTAALFLSPGGGRVREGLTATGRTSGDSFQEASGEPADESNADVNDSPAIRASFDDLLLVRAPELLGGLLVGMDRWVVNSIAGTIATFARVGAWVAARADEGILAAPADFVAVRLVRAGHGMEPVIGATLARVAWALLAGIAIVAMALAFWPER